MKISPFLTAIAKDYNPKIEYVAFCHLEDNETGWVQRRESFEEYRILIDRKKLVCPHRILFTLFHEIGHVALCHLGYFYFMGGRDVAQAKELEADSWAFKEMRMINRKRQVKQECKICYQCMKTKSKVCLKGLDVR